jgi:hypothetical protein
VKDEFSNTWPHTGRRRFLKNAVLAGGGTLLSAGGLNLMSPPIWREPLGLDLNHSFWVRSQPPQNPPLEKDLHVDVAVVGGGLTGQAMRLLQIWGSSEIR